MIKHYHPPGLWKAVTGFVSTIHDENGTAIVTIRDVGPVSAQHKLAHLIAAAPETAAERDRLKAVNADLLAALTDALYGLKWAADHGYVETLDVEKYLETGREAIAKAKETT